MSCHSYVLILYNLGLLLIILKIHEHYVIIMYNIIIQSVCLGLTSVALVGYVGQLLKKKSMKTYPLCRAPSHPILQSNQEHASLTSLLDDAIFFQTKVS